MKLLFQYGLILFCLIFALMTVACGCGDDDDDSGDGDDDVDDDADDDADDDNDDDVDDDDSGMEFRIAVISDPTITPCDMEDLNQNLDLVVDNLNGLKADIDFVVILGDLAARYYLPWWEDDWWEGPEFDPDKTWEDAMAIAMESLSRLNLPYYLVPGDKDFSESVNFEPYSFDWADWDQRLARLKELLGDSFPGDNPWYAFSHKGVRFFAANSMAGGSWDKWSGNIGTLGADQMDVIADDIDSAGQPFILMSHHGAPAISESLIAPSRAGTLIDLIEGGSESIIGLFNGHHANYNEYEYAGETAYAFDSVLEGSGNYAIVQIDPATGIITIVNKDELSFDEDPEDFLCEPGEDTVGSLGNFEGTFHGLFIENIRTGNPIIDMLFDAFAEVTMGFVMWVTEDLGGGAYDILFTHGYYFWSPEIAEHAFVPNWNNPPCEIFEWQLDDPCMMTSNAEIGWDLVDAFDMYGNHGMCGVTAIWNFTPTFEAKMGLDDSNGMSFEDVRISIDIDGSEFLELAKQVLVDTYCAWECWEPLMTPEEGCDAVENGHEAACDAETLTFDDVPDQCDTIFPESLGIPLRVLISLIELAIEDQEFDFQFEGWGHTMELVDDFDSIVEWSIHKEVFGLDCPVMPTA